MDTLNNKDTLGGLIVGASENNPLGLFTHLDPHLGSFK